MVQLPIVITSINQPTEPVQEYAKFSNTMTIVVGDHKTPANYAYANVVYLPIRAQQKYFPRLAKLLPENVYSRKNIGYLWAIKNSDSDYIFDTDDDNSPYPLFPTFLKGETKVPVVAAQRKFINFFKLFSRQHAWPRGFPLNLVNTQIDYTLAKHTVRPLLQQSLIDNDSDFDAVYRMLIGREIKFAKGKKFALQNGVYGQVNSQATFWHRQIFTLMYFPTTLSWRTADIWRGYIAQRIIWSENGSLIYLSPNVYQKRLRHNPQADMRSELDVFTKSEQFIEVLDSIEFEPNQTVVEKQLQVYLQLVDAKLVDNQEIKMLKAWQSELQN